MILCLRFWKCAVLSTLTMVATLSFADGVSIRNLAPFACTHCVLRTPEETATWLQYKNGKNSSPKLVDLGAESGRDVCLHLLKIRGDWGDIGDPTFYEEKVIGLRKGDRVKFGATVFHLGEFLGAGNTTHIFRLQGEKGVLRIPFIVPTSIGRTKGGMELGEAEETSQDRRMNAILYLSLHFKEALQSKKNAVKILKSDPKGRYIVVEEIDGDESGLDFLQSIATRRLTADWKNFELDKDIQDRSRLSPEQDEKLDALAATMLSNHDAQLVPGGTMQISYLSTLASRQYVWDRTLKRWLLADAE